MSGKEHGKQKSEVVKSKTKNDTTRIKIDPDFKDGTCETHLHGPCEEREVVENSTDEGRNTAGETNIQSTASDEGNALHGSSKHAKPSINPVITISEPISSPCKVPQDPRGRCPIYYGIKSYIHDFYFPPDKDILKNEDYFQEDDFRFLVEPGKRRWRNWWLRVSLWVGVNLMLLGVIALLVGHLTAPRQPIVHQQDNFTVLDRWAVAFNNRLVICQIAGLAAFTSGAVVVMLALLVSSYQSPGYYVMTATLVPESMMAAPQAGLLSRIPLTGSVRGVQPTFVRTG